MDSIDSISNVFDNNNNNNNNLPTTTTTIMIIVCPRLDLKKQNRLSQMMINVGVCVWSTNNRKKLRQIDDGRWCVYSLFLSSSWQWYQWNEINQSMEQKVIKNRKFDPEKKSSGLTYFLWPFFPPSSSNQKPNQNWKTTSIPPPKAYFSGPNNNKFERRKHCPKNQFVIDIIFFVCLDLDSRKWSEKWNEERDREREICVVFIFLSSFPLL